ncbi:HEAT repeat domain-containing protein [Gemmatimonadota bacterium]
MSGKAELEVLVKEVGSPELFYSKPQQRDSLIAVLAGKSEKDPAALIDLLNTPWALHFEVVRRALELLGEPAAQALRDKISEESGEVPLEMLLIAFENLGQKGDEKILDAALTRSNPGLEVAAARCLAVFGSGEQAFGMLLPWLDHPEARVRQAAAWAVGKVWERSPVEDLSDTLVSGMRALVSDNNPFVRFTAAETLSIISPQADIILEPLKRGRQ